MSYGSTALAGSTRARPRRGRVVRSAEWSESSYPPHGAQGQYLDRSTDPYGEAVPVPGSSWAASRSSVSLADRRGPFARGAPAHASVSGAREPIPVVEVRTRGSGRHQVHGTRHGPEPRRVVLRSGCGWWSAGCLGSGILLWGAWGFWLLGLLGGGGFFLLPRRVIVAARTARVKAMSGSVSLGLVALTRAVRAAVGGYRGRGKSG